MNKYTPSRSTIVSGMLLVVVLAAVLPFVAFAVPQFVGAEESYVVGSSSMRPALEAGDVIFVEDVPPESVEVGDVITYREGAVEVIENGEADFITHRVVEVIETDDGRLFQTKGDANNAPDQQAVAAANVVGRVSFHLPYLGHALAFTTTNVGIFTLVIVPVGLLILGEVYDLAIAARNTRRRADGTTDAEPQADADGSVVENDAAPRTNTDESMTEIAPPSGFDPGVSVAGNGTPVDAHETRAEPTDPTPGDENGGMDDA
jgi:signal peptidase